MSDALVAFLRARLDEDTESAQALRRRLELDDVPDEGLCARVLAEVEAKRRIIDLHYMVNAFNPDDTYDPTCPGEDFHTGPPPDDCETLRELTLLYADHPDYRPEWRPRRDGRWLSQE